MGRRNGVAWTAVLTTICLLVAPGAWADQTKPPEDDAYELHKLLVDTLDQVERNYVKDISRRELIDAAIRGVLKELDPYSSYIDPDKMIRFRSSVEAEFGGIGIQVSMEAEQLTIISPLVGTPAYRAGLLAGDRIVEVDGKSTEGISLDEAVRWLKGKDGSEVRLTVIHTGKTEKDKSEVTLTREVIHVDTVLGDRRGDDDAWEFMFDAEKRIGYIRISAFSRGTARELGKAMEKLSTAGLQGLVLDLRYNPGGLLSSAIAISDMYVPKGRIVSTKGRNTPERTWDAHEKDTHEGFPMAVLVNRYSASASEIVAACLQDHDRAVVIGERTWGKGSVQNVIELEHGRSALKLTTASYRRPNGKNIHRFPKAKDSDEWGVMPSDGYEVKLTPREMIELTRIRRQRDIVLPHDKEPVEDPDPAKPGEGETSAPVEEPTPEEPTPEEPTPEEPTPEEPTPEEPT
ncbi:MAG: S41 family peptidase, partial [Planctomycetes bacterium]|nr:S41 family peptidase [Planctomycetota bacterium]